MAAAASKERSSRSISDTLDYNKRVIVYSDTDWGGHSRGKTAEFVDFGLFVCSGRRGSPIQICISLDSVSMRPDRLNCVVVCFCADNSEMPPSPPPPLSLFLSFYLFFCGMMMSYGSLM